MRLKHGHKTHWRKALGRPAHTRTWLLNAAYNDHPPAPGPNTLQTQSPGAPHEVRWGCSPQTCSSLHNIMDVASRCLRATPNLQDRPGLVVGKGRCGCRNCLVLYLILYTYLEAPPSCMHSPVRESLSSCLALEM